MKNIYECDAVGSFSENDYCLTDDGTYEAGSKINLEWYHFDRKTTNKAQN